MGGSAPGPDPAVQAAQREERARAQRERDRLRKERIAAQDARRRGARGRRVLIGTEGGELGVKSLLGGDNK